MFKNKKLLIVGGTGSFGKAMLIRILKKKINLFIIIIANNCLVQHILLRIVHLRGNIQDYIEKYPIRICYI